MFRQLCLAALIAPLVSALSVQVPQNPTSEGNITINWTSDSNDPPAFTIELVNKQFNNALAIANNVNTTLGSITLALPPVPVSDGYSIDAVNVIDITDVFASSGAFSIGAAVPPTHSTSATAAGSTNTNTSPNTASGTSAGSGSGSGTNTATSPSSASTSHNSAGASNSNSNSPSASSASPSTTSPSGAISSRMGGGSITALFISIAAGAAAIML